MEDNQIFDRPISDYPRLLRRYMRLNELSTDLVSTLNIDTLLHRIVESARELTECEAVSLLLLDPQTGNLKFEASTDLLLEGLGCTTVPTDNSIAGWIFSHSQPLLVEDALQDIRFFREVDVLTRFETKNILGVPLRTKDKTLGVIEAINKDKGSFDEEDLRLLQTLAAQAAIAIENARSSAQDCSCGMGAVRRYTSNRVPGVTAVRAFFERVSVLPSTSTTRTAARTTS